MDTTELYNEPGPRCISSEVLLRYLIWPRLDFPREPIAVGAVRTWGKGSNGRFRSRHKTGNWVTPKRVAPSRPSSCNIAADRRVWVMA